MDLKKILRFHHVTSMSSYFPKVPNVFLKDPSKNTSLYLISFAQISFALLTYIQVSQRGATTAQKLLFWGASKICVRGGGNQNGPSQNKNKIKNQNLGGSPSNENLGLFGFGYFALQIFQNLKFARFWFLISHCLLQEVNESVCA